MPIAGPPDGGMPKDGLGPKAKPKEKKREGPEWLAIAGKHGHFHHRDPPYWRLFIPPY